MISQEAILYLCSAAPGLLLGANAIRLQVASIIMEKALKRYDPVLKEFQESQPIQTIKPLPGGNTSEIQSLLHDFDRILKEAKAFKATELPIMPTDIFDSSAKYSAYVHDLFKKLKENFTLDIAMSLSADILSDAILSQALLRAFPNVAEFANAGQLTNLTLGPELTKILDHTGIINAASSILHSMASVISEQAVVAIGQVIADPTLAVFTLISIGNRERKLIEAGHSTPGESLGYGLIEYGGTVAAILAGMAGGSLLGPIGALLGGIGGGIGGRTAAKALVREKIKERLKSLSDEFSGAVHNGRQKIEIGKKQFVEGVGATANASIQQHARTVHGCPDIEKNASVVRIADEFGQAVKKDVDAIYTEIDAGLGHTISHIGYATPLQCFIGANWRREIIRRAKNIAWEKKAPFSPFRRAFYDRTAKPTSMLTAALQNGLIPGSQSAQVFVRVSSQFINAINGHKKDLTAWSDRCANASKEAQNKTKTALNEQRQKLANTVDGVRSDLQYRERQILSQAARLQAT